MAGGSSKSMTRRQLPSRSRRTSGPQGSSPQNPNFAGGANADSPSDSPPPQGDGEVQAEAIKQGKADHAQARPGARRMERDTPPPPERDDEDSLSNTDSGDTGSTTTSSRTSPKPQAASRSAPRPPISMDTGGETGESSSSSSASLTLQTATASSAGVSSAPSSAHGAPAQAKQQQQAQSERRESQRSRRPADHNSTASSEAVDRAETEGILAAVMPRLDQLFVGGMYRPWFHTKFYKAVPIARRQRVNDLKLIIQMEKEMGLDALPKPRPVRDKRRRATSEGSDDEDDEIKPAAEDTWVNCDTCGKWRKVPLREKSSIDLNKSFQCSLLSNVSCSTPEEFWEDDGWEDEQDGNSSPLPKSKKRRQGEAAAAAPQSKARGGATLAVTLQRSCSPPRAGGGSSQSGGRLQRSGSPKRGSDKSMPLSPPGACPGSPTAAAGGPSMSRLEAVIRVLRSLKKVMHYEALTKQALRMGLIRFSGSQGTAGESMKAFLNKIIRENRSNSIVNLGKGIYGLKEWVVEGGVVVDAGEGGNGGDSKSSPLTQHSGILNWNDFQHRYGGRGHSREQLHDMYLTTCGGSVDPSPRGSGPGSFPPTPTESFAKSQAEAMSGITSPKCGGGVTGLAAILAGGFADGGLPPQQGNANGEDIKDRRMMVMDLIN